MSKENSTFDIEERLIDFAVRITRTAETLLKTKTGNHSPKKQNFIIRNSLTPRDGLMPREPGMPKAALDIRYSL
ncbi:MAG: hypothetical protein A2521_11220 [Deltaproteobacteria bacterium RIFOXYD12_FULL_57_12]|nr:MAG: hypothetical protein A2521_11220 [Deltaproteobacteria bacterium RIFOXYD12_FULL_57_12]